MLRKALVLLFLLCALAVAAPILQSISTNVLNVTVAAAMDQNFTTGALKTTNLGTTTARYLRISPALEINSLLDTYTSPKQKGSKLHTSQGVDSTPLHGTIAEGEAKTKLSGFVMNRTYDSVPGSKAEAFESGSPVFIDHLSVSFCGSPSSTFFIQQNGCQDGVLIF
ncbi:hypothetical protein H920_13606 [Fukomys damarensis]|uniref:Uncharacterized protein n=1 Tax=Fukomys damarensis TaxID=885580 RepID=A0A091D458_FUKDA|nr:hypothetical protein H920_13606 [Fukomys damarensis]